MMNSWIIGVGICLCSSVLSNVGVNLQKKFHMDCYLPSVVWRLGVLLVFVGSALDFMALMFADQNIIAPMGSFTLISNMIVANLMLDEKVETRDVISTLFIGLGCITSVLFADHHVSFGTVEEMYEVIEVPSYYIVSYAIIWILYTLVEFVEKERIDLRYIVIPITSAFIGAQSVALGKVVAVITKFALFHDIPPAQKYKIIASPYTYLITYFLGVSLIAQIEMINRALKYYPTMVVVPIFQSFWIIFSVISGYFLFDKKINLIFTFGVVFTMIGLSMLSSNRNENHYMRAK